MRNRIFILLTFFVLGMHLFPNIIRAQSGATISVDPPVLFGPTDEFTGNIYLEDWEPSSTDTYYIFTESEAGTRSPPKQVTFQALGIGGGGASIILDQALGNARIYLSKRSASGEVALVTAIHYNFGTRSTCTDCPPIGALPPGAEIEIPDPEPTVTIPVTPGDPPLPPVEVTPGTGVYYQNTIMNFSSLSTQFIIAIAVIASVFLLPYMGILWGSGNPENIKKATEWFYSWLTGLIFLLLSGIIVRIIGTEVLSIGF